MVYNYARMFASANKNAVSVYSRLRIAEKYLLFAIANRRKMNYITVKEAAEKWGVSPRRVQILCSQNRIPGTVRFSNRLMIPSDAAYPSKDDDKSGSVPFPRRTPFLYMSDLYSRPGSAEESIAALADNYEAQVLFAAEIA